MKMEACHPLYYDSPFKMGHESLGFQGLNKGLTHRQL